MTVSRQQQLDKLGNIQTRQTGQTFDVVVLGGGINGACLYDALCRQGYRVLLVDKGDFASGTSQSSGMMVWGGLLYLRNLDLASVFQLSSDRDRIIDAKAGWMAPMTMRYLPATRLGRKKWWVQSGLWLYWLMGMGRRRIPRSESSFSELQLIKPGQANGSLTYEEAFLDQSDARFVYRWIAPDRVESQVALNYCTVKGDYAPSDRRWHLTLHDDISGAKFAIQSTMIVNCAGIWTDRVNEEFGIDSPFRHALSKGVYLGLPRDACHETPLFHDLGEHDDVITHVPWGPISLWGPTETAVQSIEEGARASNADIDYLLEHHARRYGRSFTRAEIISVRCGIRPLVIDARYRGDRYPLDLSRRQEVVRHAKLPWISCYGGKITGCNRMAEKVLKVMKRSVVPTGVRRTDPEPGEQSPRTMRFPGLSQPVISPAWCAAHELVCTLDDYLRRRTNIAQWVQRGGFGMADENAPILKGIALDIAMGDTVLAQQLFDDYRSKVENERAPLANGSVDDHQASFPQRQGARL